MNNDTLKLFYNGDKAMTTTKNSTRRTFVKQSAIGAGTLFLANASTVTGTTANSKIQFGILGCGGRGNFVGQKFMDNAKDDIQIVALYDPFRDRAENLQVKFDVDSSRLYVGLDAYIELIESDVDAVAITSPPYFHPPQVRKAVESNKHVYMAKPVAVDVPGCMHILESSKMADGKLNFLVDFQTRNSPNFKEIVRRVHNGDAGELTLGHVYYHAGRLTPKDKPGMSKDEARLRNWVFDIELSGDIIVEQNVHVLDVANWYIGKHPISAQGSCGRKVRTDVGDCMDHFCVRYEYPGGVMVDFSSAQFTKGYDDLCIRMYGSKGTADSHYNGPVRLTGDNPWEGTDHDNTWNCVDHNITDFVKALRSSDYINFGDYAVESTLTGVLGREAAYSKEPYTWERMMKENKKYEVDLKI